MSDSKYERFHQATYQPSVTVGITQQVLDLLAEYEFTTAIIVNTASACGFTRQYADLQKLYNNYQDQGLLVIAQPANQFKQQEPGTDQEIQQFCKINYDVTFPVLPKADVIGWGATDLFKALKVATEQEPLWNFQKYVVSKKHMQISTHSHFDEIDQEFINRIEKTL